MSNVWQVCVESHVGISEITNFMANLKKAAEKYDQQLLIGIISSHDKCSYKDLESYSHFVWEKLNTGHWRDISIIWRQLFAVIKILQIMKISRCLTAKYEFKEEVIKDLIKMCDMALLMGAPILNHLCGKLASSLSKLILSNIDYSYAEKSFPNECNYEGECAAKVIKLEQCSYPRPQNPLKVKFLPCMNDMNLEDFLEHNFIKEIPVLLSGLMDSWPAVSKWSVQYFRGQHGFRSVPVEIGERYTDDNWTQTIMTINQFIHRYMLKTGEAEGPKGYLAQHQLLDQIPELMDDIETPEFCHCGEDDDVDVNIWFGPSGTVSPLHTDPKHNLLCQVFGKKYIRLYPKSQSSKIYPYQNDPLFFNTSRINLEDDEKLYDEFPEFGKAEGFECVLEAGQTLYIPPGCWHFVKSLTPSCSLSFWFQ